MTFYDFITSSIHPVQSSFCIIIGFIAFCTTKKNMTLMTFTRPTYYKATQENKR